MTCFLTKSLFSLAICETGMVFGDELGGATAAFL